jgi:hypothetical protein
VVVLFMPSVYTICPNFFMLSTLDGSNVSKNSLKQGEAYEISLK